MTGGILIFDRWVRGKMKKIESYAMREHIVMNLESLFIDFGSTCFTPEKTAFGDLG